MSTPRKREELEKLAREFGVLGVEELPYEALREIVKTFLKVRAAQ